MRQNLKEKGLEEPLVVRAPGSEKMSEVLLDFADPLLEQTQDDDGRAFQNTIGIAIFSWNVSLLPEEKWKSSIEDIVQKLGQSDEEMAMTKSIIQMLIQRRLEYFPDITRFIFDYEILDQGDNWHLNVISTLE